MIYQGSNSVEIRHFHMFCGLGGGAQGFNNGHARVGSAIAKFRCIGGIDVDPAGIADFTKRAGVQGTVLDLFNREQYVAFHGKEPPAGWREVTSADIHAAAGHERPHVGFLSSPCKGYSALLSPALSKTKKYQALNQLALRGVWLLCEAYKDSPIELLLFENVPQIASRGRVLLDQIIALLEHYGYAVSESSHCCGEIGGLASRRKRYLLVARHKEKVPAFLYQPPKRPLRAIGDVLGRLPLPGDPLAGVMHRVAPLYWKTWVRLAFVEAGSDWRSLERLSVADGIVQDYLVFPESRRSDYLGVTPWTSPAGTVAGRSSATNGRYSVADPRFEPSKTYHGQQYGVIAWNQTMGAVTGQRAPGQGRFSVADPRCKSSVNLPRYQLVRSELEAGECSLDGNDTPLPGENDKVVARIKSFDGTWKRPFTVLELAALQGLYDPDSIEEMSLAGNSETAWRERIGNAVPAPAAQAIASMMGETLLLAWAGESFTLSSSPLWVRPGHHAGLREVAVGMSVDTSVLLPH